MKLFVLLAVVIVLLPWAPQSQHTLDPQLASRARAYFHALELADYRALWSASSKRLRNEQAED